MAYCASCGAYIPDGQTVCLACGFDPEAEARKQKKAEAAAARATRSAQTDDELREQMKRRRAQQQADSKKWAEQEYARRQQQQSNRQWAEEEYARRKQQNTRYSGQRTSVNPENAAGATGNKALAAMSYLSFLFLVPMLGMPQDSYAQFHAKQGMRLFVFGILAQIVTGIVSMGWIAPLVQLYFIVKGVSNAINGKKEPLPYIGTFGEK